MFKPVITDYRPEFPPAYLANGLIGLRLGKIPLLDGTAVVNGFVGINDLENLEGYAPAPNPVGGDLLLGDVWLSQRPDLATFREQAYDFATGELHSRFDFAANGATARVEVVTFCCRSMPAIVAQEIRVQVDKPGLLTLRAVMDPKGLPGRSRLRDVPNPGWTVVDACQHWESNGGLATCGAAYVTELVGGGVERKRNFWGYGAHPITTDYRIDAVPGKDYVLRQIGGLVPSCMHPEPDRQAIRLVGTATYRGFEALRAENRAAWADLWRGRVRLIGADRKWQDMVDAAFFYLHSSVHEAMPNSVAPFAVGQWSYYQGHVFWDTETFMFPPVLLTAPRVAKAMLDYRTRRLEMARNNALLNGYRGLQFPWQSCTYGSEGLPAWALGVFAEEHINFDVAFAFAQYAHATGDAVFLRQQCWPVLEGVAEWIVARVAETARGFEIRHVTGVDEGTGNVDNDSYTNLAAILILREAIAAAGKLGLDAPAAWDEIARRMFIPLDPATKILHHHDRFAKGEGLSCLETMYALYPLNYRASAEIENATYAHCLAKVHRPLRGPHAPPMMSVLAARWGDRKQAAAFLAEGMGGYPTAPFLQPLEVGLPAGRATAPAVVPFVTNSGSTMMACLLGFTGLQLDGGDPQGWRKFPITMPEGWDGIEVERIWVRGRPASLRARHGDRLATIVPTAPAAKR